MGIHCNNHLSARWARLGLGFHLEFSKNISNHWQPAKTLRFTLRFIGAEWTRIPSWICVQFRADNCLNSEAIHLNGNYAGQCWRRRIFHHGFSKNGPGNSWRKIDMTAMARISPFKIVLIRCKNCAVFPREFFRPGPLKCEHTLTMEHKVLKHRVFKKVTKLFIIESLIYITLDNHRFSNAFFMKTN